MSLSKRSSLPKRISKATLREWRRSSKSALMHASYRLRRAESLLTTWSRRSNRPLRPQTSRLTHSLASSRVGYRLLPIKHSRRTPTHISSSQISKRISTRHSTSSTRKLDSFFYSKTKRISIQSKSSIITFRKWLGLCSARSIQSNPQSSSTATTKISPQR